MIDRDLEIRTPDGDMTTFISHPEGDGPYPLILFLMDAPGKREELHDMARRLAAKGYYVMLPNLYYRRTPVFDVVAEGRDVMREHMASLSIPAVCQDVAAMLEFTTGDSAARAGAIGCVGYCMSELQFVCGTVCLCTGGVGTADSGIGVDTRRHAVFRSTGLSSSAGRSRQR